MPVEEFEVFVKDTKKRFEELLSECDANSIQMREFLTHVFEQTSNNFEEEVIIETLKETI